MPSASQLARIASRGCYFIGVLLKVRNQAAGFGDDLG